MKTKIYNSPLVGLIVSLLVNLLFVMLLLNLGDYVSVSKKIFVIILASITGLALIVNGLFVWGFAYKKTGVRKVFVIVSLFLMLVSGFAYSFTQRLNKGIDKLIDKETNEQVDYSFVTLDQMLTTNNLEEDQTIGYVAGENDFNETVKKEITKFSPVIEIVEYDRYEDMLHAMLEAEELDVAILPSQFVRYAESMSEEAQEKLIESKVIHDFNIEMKGVSQDTPKVLEEPFTILLLGMNDNLSDSIILATVNPQTLNVTMTSIARDSYVPIACYSNKSSDKINHSRGRSRECLINTVQNLMDVEIDFYFEADFYAIVKITDALGGLEIDSPITFAGSLPMEDNPRKYEGVTVPKGKNLLNGKQVITFARERKHFGSGDFQRQLNQQYVIKELANKIISESMKNPETLLKVLKGAESNIVMNLSMNKDIAPLLGYAINNIAASPVSAMDTFTIQSSQLHGSTPMINGASVVLPYKNSVTDNKKIIHDNLSTEIENPKEESFTFSINKPFEFEVITYPEKYYGTPFISKHTPDVEIEDDQDIDEVETEKKYVVPNFNGMSKAEIKAWASKNGVTLEINIVDKDYESYDDGQVIYQSIEPGSYNTISSTLIVSIVEKPKVEKPVDPGTGDGEDGSSGEGNETEPGDETEPGGGGDDGSSGSDSGTDGGASGPQD